MLFGSVEVSEGERQQGVPEQYNATMFESLRWRYHARPDDSKLHGNPKVILDVRAIPEQYFEDPVVYSIHRPVREYCRTSKEMAFSDINQQPIAVNHYLGSWERYSARKDKRRSRAAYQAKARWSKEKDDGMRPWLQGFVNAIGEPDASYLLGRAYLAAKDDNAIVTTK
jgi:hypothetical protein